MNLYAIRDRLIGYFMRPFPAETNFGVLAAISKAINDEDNNDALAKTPHHFEIWKLGEFNEETGKLTSQPEFLADCTSLVREGIRPGRAGRGQEAQSPAGEAQRGIQGAASPTGAIDRPVQIEAPGEAIEAPAAPWPAGGRH